MHAPDRRRPHELDNTRDNRRRPRISLHFRPGSNFKALIGIGVRIVAKGTLTVERIVRF
jgi:hypothetical protein